MGTCDRREPEEWFPSRILFLILFFGLQLTSLSLSNLHVSYASPSLITISVTEELQPPALDFDLAASSPSPVAIGQPFTATVTITGSKDFSGRVIIAGEFPSGLLCGPINPAFVYSSGTAKVDCSSRKPGTYKIMITGYAVCSSSDYYGPCSRTTELDVTVLGSALNPVYFYGGIGALVAVLETITRGFYHIIRKPSCKSG